MVVRWRDEEPLVEESGISKQLVVKTNYGKLNTAYWSTKHSCWYVDGLIASKEYVVAWLDGLDE